MDVNYSTIDSVLFVCMGNICRSPTAESVFRHKAAQQCKQVNIDSAGTIGAHAREKPDHRSVKVGQSAGYSFDGIKARKVTVNDFEHFDLILAMDENNYNDLIDLAPQESAHKVKLFLDFAENFDEREVPDPYYGGAGGFKYVLELVEDASEGLLAKMR